MSHARRYKRILIAPEWLLDLFTSGSHSPYEVIADAVPPDAKLVNVRHGWANEIEILVESQDFDEISEGSEIPKLSPVIRSQ